jgi:hypothetical protein
MMPDPSISRAASASGLAGKVRAWPRWWPAAFLIALAVTVALMPGFFGGGSDDWQYLNAARCWVRHGPCLPANHWEGRWPAVVPLAAMLAMFGESRASVGLWPFLSGCMALGLIVIAGNRIGGRPVGWVTAILLLFTPAVATLFLTPSVELLELALLVGGAIATALWVRRREAGSAALAGLAFALAVQVRETAIIGVAFAALFVVMQRPRVTELLPAAACFVAPLLIEMLVCWRVTGDPFYRRHLSMAHTTLVSPELLGPVDPQHAPFFNKAYIANWRREPGIHWHWSIDGFVNLFANARAGWSLPFGALLFLLFRKRIGPGERRLAGRLYAMAIAYMAVLIYALAVDPKPRIMIVPLAATSLGLAVLLRALWRNGEAVLATFLIAGHIVSGAAILFVQPRLQGVEAGAARWSARLPACLDADPYTLRHRALVPGIKTVVPLGAGRPYMLHATELGCRNVAAKAGLPANSVALVDVLPMHRVSAFNAGSELCLFRYRRHFAGDEIWSMIQRSFVR